MAVQFSSGRRMKGRGTGGYIETGNLAGVRLSLGADCQSRTSKPRTRVPGKLGRVRSRNWELSFICATFLAGSSLNPVSLSCVISRMRLFLREDGLWRPGVDKERGTLWIRGLAQHLARRTRVYSSRGQPFLYFPICSPPFSRRAGDRG